MEHILNVLGYYRRLSNTDFNGPCLKSEEKFRYKRTLSSDTIRYTNTIKIRVTHENTVFQI